MINGLLAVMAELLPNVAMAPFVESIGARTGIAAASALYGLHLLARDKRGEQAEQVVRLLRDIQDVDQLSRNDLKQRLSIFEFDGSIDHERIISDLSLLHQASTAQRQGLDALRDFISQNTIFVKSLVDLVERLTSDHADSRKEVSLIQNDIQKLRRDTELLILLNAPQFSWPRHHPGRHQDPRKIPPQLSHLYRTLVSARCTTSRRECIQKFSYVAAQSRQLSMEDERIAAPASILASCAETELAELETESMEDRMHHRLLATDLCEAVLDKPNSAVAVASYANAAVDLAFDPLLRFAQDARKVTRAKLARATNYLHSAIGATPSPYLRSLLLTQQASVQRCKAHLFPRQASVLIDRSVAAASRACKEAPKSALAMIALGQSLWALANNSKTTSEYRTTLSEAEALLSAADDAGSVLATIVLLRFYRLTYKPHRAIETFYKYRALENNPRRLSRHVVFFAEAVIQQYYRTPTADDFVNHLHVARLALRQAIDLGYGTPRTLVILARLEGALGEKNAASTILSSLDRTSHTSLSELVATFRKCLPGAQHHPIDQAFLLGLHDAEVWNSLGTYSRDVERDWYIARDCYEIGLEIQTSHIVLRTNLASLLLERPSEATLSRAKELLDYAKDHAKPSFPWWKPVARQLEAALRDKRGAADN